jgi:pimeloyl-ACP methyl ester carboxylesterase
MREDIMIEKVRSKDGTLIAYQRGGEGPPLVLVHGTLGSCRRWPVVPALEQRFTVCAIERRGRGESGDAPNYAIEREFEDVAALVDSIGEPVNLLGHSFGGLIALEAALLTDNLRRLIIYESPPILPPYPDGTLKRLETLLDAGDREGAVTTFLSEIAQIPARELEILKASPIYPPMIDAAHTVPRELRTEEAFRIETARFSQLSVPTLLLMGSDSPDIFRSSIEAWHAVLPNSRLVEFPDQQHLAHITAPDLFVREVQTFLQEPD